MHAEMASPSPDSTPVVGGLGLAAAPVAPARDSPLSEASPPREAAGRGAGPQGTSVAVAPLPPPAVPLLDLAGLLDRRAAAQVAATPGEGLLPGGAPLTPASDGPLSISRVAVSLPPTARPPAAPAVPEDRPLTTLGRPPRGDDSELLASPSPLSTLLLDSGQEEETSGRAAGGGLDDASSRPRLYAAGDAASVDAWRLPDDERPLGELRAGGARNWLQERRSEAAATATLAGERHPRPPLTTRPASANPHAVHLDLALDEASPSGAAVDGGLQPLQLEPLLRQADSQVQASASSGDNAAAVAHHEEAPAASGRELELPNLPSSSSV